MKKLRQVLILCLLSSVSLIGVIGCNSVEKPESEFDLEQFEIEMKSKGYEYKRQDVQESLLTPVSQYMCLDDSIIVNDRQVILYDTDVIIYSYEDNKEMEKEASTINEDASEISKKDNPIQLNWPQTPHFYKKGKIIVQYVGDDEEIISDLEDIMGEQFAGRG